MLCYDKVKDKPNVLLAFTSLTKPEFEKLLVAFRQAWQEYIKNEFVNGQERQRQYGGGRKATLKTEADGLLFILFYGMDTPERGDYFFSEATEANRALVEGQPVILVKDVSETDRYGRLLRYVYLEDGTFVNAELVRQGYAVIATFPPDVRHQELFLELERDARAAGRGLWTQPSDNEPLPTNAPAATNPPSPVWGRLNSSALIPYPKLGKNVTISTSW